MGCALLARAQDVVVRTTSVRTAWDRGPACRECASGPAFGDRPDPRGIIFSTMRGSHESSISRYGGQWWFPRVYVALFAILAACFIIELAVGPISAMATGFLLGYVVLLSLLIALSSSVWRKIVLTESQLRVPKGFGFGSTKIPVSEIAGVGLLYCYWPRWTGYRQVNRWSLYFWRSDGSRISDPAFGIVDKEKEPKGVRLKQRRLDEAWVAERMANASSDHLAQSNPGRIASDIYQRVVDLQGPSGSLTVNQLQKTSGSWSNQDPAALTIGYWSPDGTLGATRWAQEREAPENPPIGWANR
jgi:hypothetical protein